VSRSAPDSFPRLDQVAAVATNFAVSMWVMWATFPLCVAGECRNLRAPASPPTVDPSSIRMHEICVRLD